VIFRLFLLLTAVLLLRPEDLRPELAGMHLYLVLIAMCLIAAAPAVVRQLTPRELGNRPTTLCVIGFFAAAMLSLVARGWLGQAVYDGVEFAKVAAFYLLLVAVLDRPERVPSFLGLLVLVVGVLAGLGLAQFHGLIDWEVLRPVAQVDYDESSGDVLAWYPRLRGAGIFNDPNDLSLILTTGILACFARSATAKRLDRLAWLMPVAAFVYALILTQSRGGFLGLAAGIVTLVVVRLGFRRGLPIAVLGGIAGILVLGGRQANLSLDSSDTTQERLRLWSDGLALLVHDPLTGIGAGQYADEVGMVAHNSFVQAFVETGLIGGTLYVGAFVMAVIGLWRLGRFDEFWENDRRFTSLRPFVLAMVVAYAAGTFSLSRNYVVPTYMMLGLATAYVRIALPSPPASERMSRTVAARLILLGVGTVVFLRIFTAVLVRF